MVIVEVRRILDGYEWRRSGVSVSGLDSWDWVRKRIRNKDQNLIWLGMGRMGRVRKLGTGRKDKMMELDNGVLVFDGYLKDTNLVREYMWNIVE